jgi:poly(3-hydroxybutyrate) depolymerase
MRTSKKMISYISKYIVSLTLFFCIIGFANAQYLFFDHDGLKREYIFYASKNLKQDAPLVILMHG